MTLKTSRHVVPIPTQLILHSTKGVHRQTILKTSRPVQTSSSSPIQEHPRTSRSSVRTHDINIARRFQVLNNFRPGGDVPGTPAFASDHERRVREVARLDRPRAAGRRRLSRVRRGARRRGGRAAARPARTLQPAAARFRGEAADVPGWSGVGRAAAASQSSLSPRHASRD